jgi:hypothetical protein
MTGSADERRDFFVSFNKADRVWATWIAWTLEDVGYKVLFQDWDFQSNFVLKMHEAIQRSHRMIAVLSPDYLTSAFTASEWAAVFAQDPTSARDLLVPVRVRACEPDGLLAQIVYLDLTANTRDQARELLLKRVSGERLKPGEEPPFPIPSASLPTAARTIKQEPRFPTPIHDLPPHNPDFVGDCDVQKLMKQLDGAGHIGRRFKPKRWMQILSKLIIAFILLLVAVWAGWAALIRSGAYVISSAIDDTCKEGFVWRKAVPDDHLCVTPDTVVTPLEQGHSEQESKGGGSSSQEARAPSQRQEASLPQRTHEAPHSLDNKSRDKSYPWIIINALDTNIDLKNVTLVDAESPVPAEKYPGQHNEIRWDLWYDRILEPNEELNTTVRTNKNLPPSSLGCSIWVNYFIPGEAWNANRMRDKPIFVNRPCESSNILRIDNELSVVERQDQ